MACDKGYFLPSDFADLNGNVTKRRLNAALCTTAEIWKRIKTCPGDKSSFDSCAFLDNTKNMLSSLLVQSYFANDLAAQIYVTLGGKFCRMGRAGSGTRTRDIQLGKLTFYH